MAVLVVVRCYRRTRGGGAGVGELVPAVVSICNSRRSKPARRHHRRRTTSRVMRRGIKRKKMSVVGTADAPLLSLLVSSACSQLFTAACDCCFYCVCCAVASFCYTVIPILLFCSAADAAPVTALPLTGHRYYYSHRCPHHYSLPIAPAPASGVAAGESFSLRQLL